MRREVGLWLPARRVVVEEQERASGESQAGVAGDEGTRVARALVSSAGTTPERVGPGGGRGTQSDLAIGHDQDLGGPQVGWAYPVCDRLLHAGDRGMESFATNAMSKESCKRSEPRGFGDVHRSLLVPLQPGVNMFAHQRLGGFRIVPAKGVENLVVLLEGVLGRIGPVAQREKRPLELAADQR